MAVAQPRAALDAVHGAFEIVLPTPGPVAGDLATSQHALDAGKGLGIDEWFVLAVVDDASVDDLTCVVRIAEQAVHRRPGEGFAAGSAIPGRESACSQRNGEITER